MIFLCFSGRDRFKIVTSILYHIENHGIKLWYDNHQYILGDKKAAKLTKSIKLSKYAIVIISKDFYNSHEAIKELEIIKRRYYRGLIHIFPIFYNITASEIDPKYLWLCNMIFNEVNDSSGTLLTCNQIVCKYYYDIICINKYPSLDNWENILPRSSCFKYINNLLELYNSISASNLNSKMSVLFCLVLYLKKYIGVDGDCLYKSANYLFNTTKLNLSYNFKEIKLLEQINEILLGMLINKLQ